MDSSKPIYIWMPWFNSLGQKAFPMEMKHSTLALVDQAQYLISDSTNDVENICTK